MVQLHSHGGSHHTVMQGLLTNTLQQACLGHLLMELGFHGPHVAEERGVKLNATVKEKREKQATFILAHHINTCSLHSANGWVAQVIVFIARGQETHTATVHLEGIKGCAGKLTLFTIQYGLILTCVKSHHWD